MEKNDRAPKIYTRTGDKGKTSLIGGTRVSKSHLRLESYGTIDELNCVIGLLRAEVAKETAPEASDAINNALFMIQNDLFNVGSQLACEDREMRSKLPGVSEEKIKGLESHMDRYTTHLTPLRNFILPGGTRSAGLAHLARTVCRRAERSCVALVENGEEVEDSVIPYINRLSDYLFVLSRYLNQLQGVEEPVWKAETAK